MTILRMRASFGCLQNAELTLAPGLNVLTLPNERGKSTWAQFLLAMFYGVDTGERAKAGSIPAKTLTSALNILPKRYIAQTSAK